jgi:hypothetical protein
VEPLAVRVADHFTGADGKVFPAMSPQWQFIVSILDPGRDKDQK